MSETWQRLGDRSPLELTEARLQQHWAAQVVAALGHSLAKPRPDSSHSSFEWMPGRNTLAGVTVDRVRAALHLPDLQLSLLDLEGVAVDSTSLAGLTVNQATDWLGSTFARFRGRSLDHPLTIPEHHPPQHPLGSGGTFNSDHHEELQEMSRWFSNAELELKKRFGGAQDASPLRCWPHHFDIATLLTIDAGGGEHARSVGVGMTPGDGTYAEPYFYVAPWPYPRDPDLPPLRGGGRWHQDGWLGAVLPGTTLIEANDQQTRLSAFLDSGVSECFRLLDSERFGTSIPETSQHAALPDP